MKKLSEKQKQAFAYLRKNRVGKYYRGDLYKLAEAFRVIELISKNHPLLR